MRLYRSLAHATIDILWLQSLLQELHIKHQTPTVLCDNLSAMSLAHNPVLYARTKHMELDIFFVSEKMLNKDLTVSHIHAFN